MVLPLGLILPIDSFAALLQDLRDILFAGGAEAALRYDQLGAPLLSSDVRAVGWREHAPMLWKGSYMSHLQRGRKETLWHVWSIRTAWSGPTVCPKILCQKWIPGAAPNCRFCGEQNNQVQSMNSPRPVTSPSASPN